MFRIVAVYELLVETKLPDDDEKYEIDCEVWEDLKPLIDQVWIRTLPRERPPVVPKVPNPIHIQQDKPSQTSHLNTSNKLRGRVLYQGGEYLFTARPMTTFGKILRLVPAIGQDPRYIDYMIMICDIKVQAEEYLADYLHLQDEDNYEISIFRQTIGGKPVIYLFSPRSMDVHVSLKLVPEWKFSALYPVAKIEEDKGDQQSSQTVSWDALVSPNGTILDRLSGSEVTYLYWEAT
jgi:hypothetical protein